jgi:hypothetical protein
MMNCTASDTYLGEDKQNRLGLAFKQRSDVKHYTNDLVANLKKNNYTGRLREIKIGPPAGTIMPMVLW